MLVLGWVTAEEQLGIVGDSWEVCISCNPMRLGSVITGHLVVTSGDHYGLLGGCISCNPMRMGGKKAI